MPAGLYEIRHAASGNRYVGSSTNLDIRFKAHRKMLIRGNHHSIALQRSWNKYGEGAFQFNALAILEKKELASTEQRLLDVCFAKEPDLYNISRGAYAPMRGRKHTEEWKSRAMEWKKGNKSRTGIPGHWSKDNPPPSVAKLVAAARNPTMATREKMRFAKLGKPTWNKGKRYKLPLLSEETRSKLRAAANKRWQLEKGDK